MSNRYSPSILLLIAMMFAEVNSHAQEGELVPVAGKSAATGGIKNDCASAAIHYELHDIPDPDIVNMFEQAAKGGDVRGTMWLARLYFKGRCSLSKRSDAAQDMARDVIDNIARLAESGDHEAQFLLGSAYQEGLAVDRDFTKAVKWYRKAVAAGHITASNNLGVMLVWGRGADPDISKARSLFALAAERGSKMAAGNLRKHRDDGRDDTERLASLRAVLLVQALGMQKDKGIAFLARHGLISDPKGYKEGVSKGDRQYHFKADGIILNVEKNDRIIVVEGHAKGSRNSEQFRGDIPFGLVWNDTKTTTRKKLGSPDDRGHVSTDHAYGMAYRIENGFLAVMFSYEGDQRLKVWRVYEKWAVKYSAQQDKSSVRAGARR
jgi:TPR repeat protein